MFDPPKTPSETSAFPATDWAVIMAAGTQEPGAHWATIRICELYWQPIYQFVRRTWPAKSADEAREATQEFFKLRLEKHDIKDLAPEKGLFRNWLQSAATNFLRSARRSSLRERERLTSLDASATDEPTTTTTLEPRTALDPWLLLERELAREILVRAFARLALEREHAARGGAEFVRQAHVLIWGTQSAEGYAELEERWGLSAGTLKVRLYSMRRRLDALICLELGVPPGDNAARERALAWFFWAIALKEEQPCPKAKALPPQRPTPS
jgi:DNA-directed RNA polymerase specialized sigma24 family protein